MTDTDTGSRYDELMMSPNPTREVKLVATYRQDPSLLSGGMGGLIQALDELEAPMLSQVLEGSRPALGDGINLDALAEAVADHPGEAA